MAKARQPRSAVGLKICDWCGHYFIAAPQHSYREKSRWFCKYTCMLRYREDVEQKKQLKKSKGGMVCPTHMSQNSLNVPSTANTIQTE